MRRTPQKAEIVQFTAKVREYLDHSLYNSLDNFLRIDDAKRYKARDFINVYGKKDGTMYTFMEKDVHYKGDFACYFELEHVNNSGQKSPGIGLQSKAKVLVVTYWEDGKDAPIGTFLLNISKLKEWGRRVLADEQMRADETTTVLGGTVASGERFQVTSLRFNAAYLPPEYYVNIDTKKETTE